MEQKIHEYIHNKEKLFDKWINKYGANDNISFAIDGIISPENWFSINSSNEKIVILLKEAYSTDGAYIWDLSKWLSHTKCNDYCEQEDCSICHVTGHTYNAVAEYIYAVLNASAGKDIPYDGNLHVNYKDYYKTRDALLSSAAIINIKKCRGTKVSDYNELVKVAKSDADLLREQIELISPTTIVCGATYDMLRVLYPQLPILKDSSDGCAKLGNIKIIATCHPNARKDRAQRYDKIVKYYNSFK